MALITGKWQWIDYPRFTNKSTIEQSINFNYAGKQYTKIRFYYHNEVDIQYIDSAGSATTIYNDDEGLWSTDIRSLDFGNTNQDVKDEFFTQFSANATQSTEPTIEGNYTQTVKTADGLLKIYPKTKAKNVMLDSSAAGITAEDVQSGIKELNDKIESAEAAAVKPNGTYPNMTAGKASSANKVANALTLNVNGVATVFDGSAAKTVDITAGGGGDSEAVKYTQQSLTTEQQQQARTNIAAAGSANTVTTDTEQTISGAKTFNAALNVNSSITGESIVAKTTDFGIMTMAPTPEGFMISTEVNGDPVGFLIFDTGFLLPGNSQHGLVSTLAYYEANMETAEVVRVYSPNNKPKPADIGAATTEQVNAKYTKPSTGIPKTDLASAVQASLDKADTALQSVPAGYATESYVTNAIAAAVTTALNTAI